MPSFEENLMNLCRLNLLDEKLDTGVEDLHAEADRAAIEHRKKQLTNRIVADIDNEKKGKEIAKL